MVHGKIRAAGHPPRSLPGLLFRRLQERDKISRINLRGTHRYRLESSLFDGSPNAIGPVNTFEETSQGQGVHQEMGRGFSQNSAEREVI